LEEEERCVDVENSEDPLARSLEVSLSQFEFQENEGGLLQKRAAPYQ